MSEIFKTVLTKRGLVKLAEATATGVALDLYQIAVGDSNGSYYEPTDEQVELVNEVGRFELNALMVEADNKKKFSAETLIPESSGGYTIREAGLFDRQGDMIAVAKVPATFKPSIESGAGSQLYFKMVGEYSNEVNITISINPTALFVTDDVMKNYIKSDVIPKIVEGDDITLSEAKSYTDELLQPTNTNISSHISNKSNPHGVTKAQVGLGNVDNTADRDKTVRSSQLLDCMDGHGIRVIRYGGPSGWSMRLYGTYINNPSSQQNDTIEVRRATIADNLLYTNVFSTNGFQIGNVTLPAGGSWFCWIALYHLASHGIYNHSSGMGIRAGGTTIYNEGSSALAVWAFRVE